MDYKLIYLARRNPQISLEDWPRAWRSHAVFASQFPVIGARISGLYYCARETAADLPGLSLEHDGVAIVASPSAGSLAGEITAEDRARIDADELRVFDTYTPNFSFDCRERLVHGGPPGQAALIRFLARKDGTRREAFLERWDGKHAQIALCVADAAGAVRQVHNRLVAEPPPGYPFDGIAETWFATPEEAARAWTDGVLAAIDDDLAEFCDPGGGVTLLTRVVHRWPRA